MAEYLTIRKNEPNTLFWSPEYNQLVHHTSSRPTLIQIFNFTSPLNYQRGINVLPYNVDIIRYRKTGKDIQSRNNEMRTSIPNRIV